MSHRGVPVSTSHQRRHKPPPAGRRSPASRRRCPLAPPVLRASSSAVLSLPLPPDAAPPPPSCRASRRDADAFPLPLDAAFLAAALLGNDPPPPPLQRRRPPTQICLVAGRLFVFKSEELVQYQVMEGSKDMQQSNTEPVVKVPREPAIIINGVPDMPPEFASGSQLAVRHAPRSRVDHRFGEWLEERKVRKRFEDVYYVGKVVKYDSQRNWYTVVYEDGDQEDLEWHEVEEILLPLDITIPLKTLVMDKFKHQNAVPNYRTKVARPRTNVASNQVVVRAANGQRSNNLPLPGLVQASASAGENALVCLKPGDQPKKRGRPRKDRSTSGEVSRQISTSGDVQPKKRGRPPKEPGEKSIDRCKLDTVRAEKLKRESMLLRGAPPGSQ